MGDTGPQVLETQQMLRDLGYAVDSMEGTFDTSTLRAVIAFQSDRSLPVDGVVAVNTWVALRKQAGRHEELSETRREDEEERTSRQEMPPVAEQPQSLEELASYMPPPIVPQPSIMAEEAPPESLPAESPAFAVATVPLIQWHPIHEEVPVFREAESPLSPESTMPMEEPTPRVRGWTRVSA